MKYLYTFICFNMLCFAFANAQATFFKTVSTTSETNRTVGQGVEFNGNYYFTAPTSTFLMRTTLWKTDGTPSGTVDFIDDEANVFDAQAMFVFNNELYYFLNELGVKKIMKTNGTTSIPFLEPTAEAPQVIFDNRTLAILDSDFIFFYGNTTTGFELYISDGTPTNTPTLLKDIRPGPNSSAPIYFTKIANNKVVFRADDGTNGRELWVTNGTTAGTNLVKDINPNGNASISGLTSFNGKAYFQSGNDIWETDGTEAGTKIFLNLRLNDNSEYPFHVYKDAMYFTAYDATFNKVDLWKTDGTVTGSTILASNLNYADVFKGTNNLLFFAAEDDAHGYELWRTDGTVIGTYLTRDIVAGPETSLASFLSEDDFGNGGDRLFFRANYEDENGNTDPNLSGELWSSNGTESGTGLYATINQMSTGSGAENFFNVFDKVLFKANIDENGNRTNQGIHLWRVDANLLSVSENEPSDTNLLLYPNPSSDYITINNQNNEIKEISIFSLEGRKIKTIAYNFDAISVQDLSAGSYLVSITLNDGKQSSLKFLKQ